MELLDHLKNNNSLFSKSKYIKTCELFHVLCILNSFKQWLYKKIKHSTDKYDICILEKQSKYVRKLKISGPVVAETGTYYLTLKKNRTFLTQKIFFDEFACGKKRLRGIR